MAMIVGRRSPQDMVSALLEEERAKEPENRACAADPAQPLLDTDGTGETVQATVTDQGTDGPSEGFPRPGWRQSSWPSLRRADETRGADPIALKPTLRVPPRLLRKYAARGSASDFAGLLPV